MLSQDPSPFPAITRRRVLAAGGRGLALVALLGAAGTACGTAPPPEPDPLEQQAELARHDSELAAAAARTAPPTLASALTEVAAERGRHATALTDEIARVAGKPSTSATSSTSAAATPPPTVADVVAALHSSADSATKLAPSLSGYRAGLVGSIAASCVTCYTVALPTGKAGQ